MYVTRRLLRSTMPPEPANEKKEIPFVPSSTPKRRAAARASAKTSDGSAPRNRPTKTSPKQTENKGDEKNKSRSQKKIKKEKQEEEPSASDTDSLHGLQLMIDVQYRGDQYAEARILALDVKKELLLVHYMGWNSRFDAWVSPDVVAAHGSHSGVAKKKDVSWDGETSLFATDKEVAALKKQDNAKSKTQKKRTILSPKARRVARRGMGSVNTDRKRHNDDVPESESEEVQPSAKRVVRKSPKKAKVAKKESVKSPRTGKKGTSKSGVQGLSGRRTPRRVQVAVGTTDEDSERKNDSETADLVLDVEIRGASSNDEADEEDVEEEEHKVTSSRTKKRANFKSKTRCQGNKEAESKRKRSSSEEDVDETTEAFGTKRSPVKKSKKGGVRKAINKPASLPDQQRDGLGSATREKLAAIFRMRVQRQQQLDHANASHTSFQQSLQDDVTEEPATTAAERSSGTTEVPDADAAHVTVANTELAAAEEYQRQLQQYYYHQQMMLANSLSMSVSGCEDPSTIPLQGGIMDPRIIQERLTALEERRRQQAHVQAYYHQLMLTRERNVRALAANQAFMAASTSVWEQQLKETQSEDGTSSVTSWKDVADTHGTDKDSPGSGNGSPKAEHMGDVDRSEDAERSEGDNSIAKENQNSSAAVVTSSDTVEKSTEGSASPSKSVSSSNKCTPSAEAPTESVLYEFVL